MPRIDKIIKIILDYYDFQKRISNESFFLTLNFTQEKNTNNIVNSSLKTFVFNSNSLLKTIFTFFTWLSIFRAGTISWGTTFHTISETFVFHFLAAFFANITFLAPASSRFDACCKWTTPPFTNCCNENKILVKKKLRIVYSTFGVPGILKPKLCIIRFAEFCTQMSFGMIYTGTVKHS